MQNDDLHSGTLRIGYHCGANGAKRDREGGASKVGLSQGIGARISPRAHFDPTVVLHEGVNIPATASCRWEKSVSTPPMFSSFIRISASKTSRIWLDAG